MEPTAVGLSVAQELRGSCMTASLGGGCSWPRTVLKDNGIRCNSVITVPFPLPPPQGPSYLALRIFTNGLQFLLHLLLPWRLDASFLLYPF